MKDDDRRLDPAWIAALRTRDRAPADVRARARARLAAVVPGMGGGSPDGGSSGGHGPAPASGPVAAGAGAVGTVHWITLAAFLVGGGVGAGLYAALRPTAPAPPPVVVYVDRPVSALPEMAPAAPLTPPQVTVDARPAAPDAPSARPAASASRSSQLAAERAMLDEARAALLQGDPSRGLDRLDLHRRTFTGALLAEEREAMSVEALARLGRGGEARARGEAFRRRWPSSLFLPTVDTALASIP